MNLSIANAPFMLCSIESMVGVTLDPSILNILIVSLESFIQTFEPWRAYSMMLVTARPAIMMKDFVAPPIPPLICAWIGLDRLHLVGLD